MSEAVEASQSVPDEPAHERGVASALLGYALEDFAADMRGVPVADAIAEDPELLSRYRDDLMGILRPIATDAVVSYAYCRRRLAALGDESPWLPWRAYCVQRGQELIGVFDLSPPEPASPEAEPDGAERSEPASTDAAAATEGAADPPTSTDAATTRPASSDTSATASDADPPADEEADASDAGADDEQPGATAP